jgi:hypothetical protein
MDTNNGLGTNRRWTQIYADNVGFDQRPCELRNFGLRSHSFGMTSARPRLGTSLGLAVRLSS